MTAPAIAPDRRQFLYAGLLAGAGAIGIGARLPTPARPPAGTLARAVPERIGRYANASALGVVLPPQDELSAQIYDQYVVRRYLAPGLPAVMLVIAYGSTQDYGLQLHRPEFCYPASGYRIGPTRRVPLALGGRRIDGAALTATRAGRREQILYWTRIGDTFPATTWAQRGAIVRAMLHGRMPDGALVRLSLLGDDPIEATGLLARFGATLVARAGAGGRRLIMGTGA